VSTSGFTPPKKVPTPATVPELPTVSVGVMTVSLFVNIPLLMLAAVSGFNALPKFVVLFEDPVFALIVIDAVLSMVRVPPT
jgi:hypothetical protein